MHGSPKLTRRPTDGDNAGAGHRAYGSCSNVYCHSIAQTATGGALTGLAGEYKTPTWGTDVACGDCHEDEDETSGGARETVAAAAISSRASKISMISASIARRSVWLIASVMTWMG